MIYTYKDRNQFIAQLYIVFYFNFDWPEYRHLLERNITTCIYILTNNSYGMFVYHRLPTLGNY